MVGVVSRLLGSTPSPTAIALLGPGPQCPLTPWILGLVPQKTQQAVGIGVQAL